MKTVLAVVSFSLALLSFNTAQAESVDCSEQGVKQVVQQWTFPAYYVVSDSAYWGVREAYKALSQCLTTASLADINAYVLPALNEVNKSFLKIEALKTQTPAEPTVE